MVYRSMSRESSLILLYNGTLKLIETNKKHVSGQEAHDPSCFMHQLEQLYRGYTTSPSLDKISALHPTADQATAKCFGSWDDGVQEGTHRM